MLDYRKERKDFALALLGVLGGSNCVSPQKLANLRSRADAIEDNNQVIKNVAAKSCTSTNIIEPYHPVQQSLLAL